MDQSQDAGQSSAAAQQQPPVINQPHSPSPNQFAPSADSSNIDLSLDPSQQQFAPDASFDSSFADSFMSAQSSQPAVSNPAAFDPSTSFAQQSAGANNLAFASQPQQTFLSPNLADGDFSLFPAGSQSDQFNQPLFESSLSPVDLNNMASPQSHHSPSSAQHSPSFSQHQFSSPNVHSRNVSLGPEAALLPGQMNEWSGAQFTNHRRAPSEYSDVSSVTHSPNVLTHDSFDDGTGHSPLQRASDGSMYQEVLGIGSFSIADHARSPSHSPAISPRIGPQHLPDMQYQASSNPSYNIPAYPTIQDPTGGFVGNPQDMNQMPAPAINIDFAPTNNAKLGGFDGTKSHLDQDSLLPPERGTSATLHLRCAYAAPALVALRLSLIPANTSRPTQVSTPIRHGSLPARRKRQAPTQQRQCHPRLQPGSSPRRLAIALAARPTKRLLGLPQTPVDVGRP